MKKETEQQGEHPEDFCQICHNPNPVWYAPHELWNKVNSSPNGIICPCCFENKANKHGINIIFKAELIGQSIEQQGKELFEWVKATELKEINYPLCTRFDGGGAYYYDTVVSMEELQHLITEQKPFSEIEYAKPVKAKEQQGNESEKIKLLETKIKELESNYMEIQTELRTAQIKKEENEKKEAV